MFLFWIKYGLAGAGRKADTGLLAIFGMTDDDARGTGSLGDVATITGVSLELADDSTLQTIKKKMKTYLNNTENELLKYVFLLLQAR